MSTDLRGLVLMRTNRFPNTTGAYELDLSLVDDFDNAYREMHIKTDVFCAGSIILPDKGGRQLNVGGWSAGKLHVRSRAISSADTARLDSLTGVRLYTPDGSPGNPSVNDWEEDFTVLALQVLGIPITVRENTD